MKKFLFSQRITRKHRGFTLVELLVVIAIIALLAGLLVPAIVRAMRRSYQAACVSNMKQSTSALQMYVDDHDEWLPPGKGSTFGLWTGQQAAYKEDTSSKYTLIYYIARYLDMPAPSSTRRIAKTFFCPGFKRYGPNVTTEADRVDYALYTPGLLQNPPINFLPFGYPPGQPSSASPSVPHALAEISAPSTVQVLSDIDQVAVLDPANTWRSQLPLTPVHLDTRNFMYFDNHVGQVPVGPPGKL